MGEKDKNSYPTGRQLPPLPPAPTTDEQIMGELRALRLSVAGQAARRDELLENISQKVTCLFWFFLGSAFLACGVAVFGWLMSFPVPR